LRVNARAKLRRVAKVCQGLHAIVVAVSWNQNPSKAALWRPSGERHILGLFQGPGLHYGGFEHCDPMDSWQRLCCLFLEQIQSWLTEEYGLRVKGGKEYTVTRTYKNNLKSRAAAWIGTDTFLDE
jgi:hypothetical protein